MDLRLPLGLLLVALGSILALFGAISDPAIYQRSLGINVNVWWGLVQVVLGLVTAFFGYRAEAARKLKA